MIATMSVAGPSAPDPRLGRARVAVLLSLALSVATTLVMPAIGLFGEPRVLWRVLGAAGILAVAATQAGALLAAATPSLAPTTRRRLVGAFFAAAVLSVPLAGPAGSLGPDGWRTWAWIGAAVVGSAPLLTRPAVAVAVSALATAVAAGVGWWAGGSPLAYAVITAGLGVSVLAVHSLPVSLWNLVLEARDGRDARARLAATEERLRFARDVHDLLGHHLSVIALKAELAERLAVADPGRAAREAGEVRVLAAAALAEMREVVHGYRAVDLDAQLDAIARVLRSSGVRCTVASTAGDLPEDVTAGLAATVREAGTNVLRHSRARWCTIEVVRRGGEVRMTVANDGVPPSAAPDAHSSGLRGLDERLAESGGRLRTSVAGGVFTLDAAIPVGAP
jgi:two-component system, NarL family, sensor histidine kinase DesK